MTRSISTDFSVNGQRYRKSTQTTDWREALSEEKKLIAEAQAGKLSATGQSFARLAFTEARERYLASRKTGTVGAEPEERTATTGAAVTLLWSNAGCARYD